METNYSFSCPLCARSTDYPVAALKEGANLTCPFCKVTINLHGHMWQYLEKDLERLRKKAGK
jgi:hypothetical protein